MVLLDETGRNRIAPFYRGITKTMVWSCLQGMMGEAAADNAYAPRCARIVLGDFCYPAGDADAAGAKELLAALPPHEMLLVPPDAEWASRIERVWDGRCRRLERYAIQKNPAAFDREWLRRLAVGVPEGYRIQPIGEDIYETVMKENWSRDFCSNFRSCEDFCQRGLGFVALKGSELAGGASSYSVYRGGLEIEVDTKPEHRRKGIAAACAARLILACLERGWYPNWDAANTASVRLAEKLGYRLEAAYPAYAVSPEPA